MGLGAYLGVMRSALRYTGSYDTQAGHLEIIIYHSSISTRDNPIYLSTAGIKQKPKPPKDNCINDSVFRIPRTIALQMERKDNREMVRK